MQLRPKPAEPKPIEGETRRNRGRSASLVGSFALASLAAALVAACTAIGGIDKLQRDDSDASLAQSDASGANNGNGSGDDTTSDGSPGSVSHFQDGGAAMLADGDIAASNCTPDPAFCGNVCGDAPDNCGQIRHCSSDCGQNNTCNTTTHKCECVQLSNLCDSRCGTLTDNCGNAADCGSCPSDGGIPLTCTSNACGCNPDSFAKTCGTKNCGTAVNNCMQTVFCGGNGTTPSSACANSGDICLANDTCCTPDTATRCANLCAGQTVVNNCGQTVTCPTSCPQGQVCTSGQCCTPDNTAACSGKECGPATNNCNQALTCPNTCASPYTCGGGGMNANTCGCTSTTECGNECGTITDNCGNPLVCNSCDDICPNGGVCNNSTHVCRCTIGCDEKAARYGALGPDMVPCP